MRRFMLVVMLPLFLILWGQSALFTVDQSEFAYRTRFGDPRAIYDGSTEAGLHLKWPWPFESVQRIDRRLQVFDLPAIESLTRDPMNRTVDKTLAVDAFVCWRIPDAKAVDAFVRSVGSPEQAKRVLGPRISGRLAAVISNMPIEDLISVATGAQIDKRMDKIRNQLLGTEGLDGEVIIGDQLQDVARNKYGIEIVDIRLRRFNYPEAVRATIAERIRSERARKVADYESDGRKRATDIATTADREARMIDTKARAERQRIEGQADVDADLIRNQAHAKDRDFYTFLQKLKAYQNILSESRDVLLLSSRHELFDMLLKPPKVPMGAQP